MWNALPRILLQLQTSKVIACGMSFLAVAEPLQNHGSTTIKYNADHGSP